MTAVEVCFRYGKVPGEREMRGIDRLWEVYGIRRIKLDEQAGTVRVEYDATRFNERMVSALLRRAGIDVCEQLALV